MNSPLDAKVPASLSALQEWFASIITRPIDVDNKMNPLSPTGNAMKSEAAQFLLPSPTLQPDQRIQIYNQQYWWRLFSTLHDIFPLTTRLFGYYDFNQTIAIPYLVQYPPHHWNLNHLGSHLPLWAKENYHEKDKFLVQEAIEIDWGCNEVFFAAELKTMNFLQASREEENSPLLTQKVFLQPHLRLFELKHELFPFRTAMLKQPVEHWQENDFPPLKKNKICYALYRKSPTLDIDWTEISPNALKLLSRFKAGCSIIDACQWLEDQEDEFITEASEKLHLWFQEWTMRQWLGTP